MNVEMIYQHSGIHNPTAESFHEACDDQGATLVFVQANGGFIFGGYNPQSWLSDFMYTEAHDAYLFQVYSPLSELERLNPAENSSLAKILDVNLGELKRITEDKTVDGQVYKLPRGPVKCPIRK